MYSDHALGETRAPATITELPATVVCAAIASIGAGALHATAVGLHSGADQAMAVFAVLAVFQIGWGALALVRRSPWVDAIGAVGNALAVGGWYLAKTSGISFVE